MSTLSRKSWQDVRRRWARSLFTTLTITVAVTGLGMFSLPTLMDRAMARQIEHDQLHDVRIFTQDVVLTQQERAELSSLPGVAAVELRTTYLTRAHIGDRREDVLLVGVEDFAHQSVNVVALEQGALPVGDEALSESQNARSGRISPSAGSEVLIETRNGSLQPVTISGQGRTLEFSQIATDDSAVFYLPQETVEAIAEARGVNSIELRVADSANAQAVVESVRALLTAGHPDIEFTDLPDVRRAGTWPGQDIFDNFVTLFYVGGVLALVSAIALISNTMTTMVAEQRREIAIMKAIGGRRLQVAFAFLRTALIFASAGSLLGAALGIPVGNLMAQYIGSEFIGVRAGWGIAWPVVLGSLLLGVAGTTLAAVPALLRGTALPVREGLQNAISGSGDGASKLLRRLPLPSTLAIGLRNITRRKTRALGTMLQVGLAVGVALGLLALGVTVTDVTTRTWDAYHWDVIVFQKSNTPLDARARDLLSGTDGIAAVQPLLYNNLRLNGEQYETWGYPPESQLYRPEIVDGRWLSVEDGATNAHVAVVGRALAAKAGLKVGQAFTAESARGPVELTVIGIDSVLTNNATAIFLPFTTFQEILGRTDTNAYWLVSSSPDHAAIDRMAARSEDELTSAGFPVGTQTRYIEKAANVASNKTLVGVLAVMGVPIVVIGLIGLINMMTMNIIERTREIGILRCLGARSRDIQGIFRSEALAVAVCGWAMAVPLGWVVGKVLVGIVAALFDFGSLPYTYPAWYPVLALVITVVLSLLVLVAPLRRASHLRPGDALRYE